MVKRGIEMSEKRYKGCWGCEHCLKVDPETNKCELTGRKFEDRLSSAFSVEIDCPLPSEEIIYKVSAVNNHDGSVSEYRLTDYWVALTQFHNFKNAQEVGYMSDTKMIRVVDGKEEIVHEVAPVEPEERPEPDFTIEMDEAKALFDAIGIRF